MDTRPTDDAYSELQRAFDFFNDRLFDGTLPPVLLTLQRNRRTYGYFAPERFGRRDGSHSHEIAINPVYFGVTPLDDVLSTLVHEQVHLWQHEHGEPGRRGYHNKQFARMLHEVGLQASATGKPGGKTTGERMDHYIIDGGAFQIAARELITSDFVLSWYDRYPPADARPTGGGSPVGDDDELDDVGDLDDGEDISADFVEVAPNRSNREKYSCPGCSVNVWGKPDLHIKCGACDLDFAIA